jgi:hypothetical protein
MRIQLRGHFDGAEEASRSGLRKRKNKAAIAICRGVAQRFPYWIDQVGGRLDGVGLGGGTQTTDQQRAIAQAVQVERGGPVSDEFRREHDYIGDGDAFALGGARDGKGITIHRGRNGAINDHGGGLRGELIAHEAEHVGRKGDRDAFGETSGGQFHFQETGAAAADGADVVEHGGVGAGRIGPNRQRRKGHKFRHGEAAGGGQRHDQSGQNCHCSIVHIVLASVNGLPLGEQSCTGRRMQNRGDSGPSGGVTAE